MKAFMDENFLLDNETAIVLYHDHAKKMPIFDYHNHLSAKEIAENKEFENITEVWLGHDHYKWRAMRSNGISEDYITGSKNDKDKFMKWAQTIPYCIGNPLYHWTHLELRRYFGIDDLLNEKTADKIWDACNTKLKDKSFTARSLIEAFNVKVLCTTDDPVDDLKYHRDIKADDTFNIVVLPTFRPDKALGIEKEGFRDWINKLSEAVGYKINSYNDLVKALKERIDYFHQIGCRLSDHALEPIVFNKGRISDVEQSFIKALREETLSQNEIMQYKTAVFLELGKQYRQLNWTMQLHIGTIRNNNEGMMKLLGPDSGFDAIGDYTFADALSKSLNELDKNDNLPKTIIYCLNPRDNYVIGSIIGCFQSGDIPGKIQFGSGWWFNDQRDGMTEQMKALANLGLLSRFVGMLTDSRSFLSFTRHEYFRRILCNLIGTWVESGEFPRDMELLGGIVEDICYNNAYGYFGIEVDK